MSHITIANCYEVLGIKSDATIKDINTAYKKLALKHHPDKTGGDESSHIEFQKIQQAVEILRDPSRRKKHDLELVKLGKISVHATTAGSSHWSATGFKKYDENSRYMYSYEQSVHVSPQNQESKEDMQWVDQMLKAEKDFRKELARQREMEQLRAQAAGMRAQAAAERAGQEENCTLHHSATEDHPCEPFEQDAHTGDVFEEDPDDWDFESTSWKEQDIWDTCAQRAPQSRDREEEIYQKIYEGAEEQELYEEFEDQEVYEDNDEEQQELYEEEVEDYQEFYEGDDYEEEDYEEEEEQEEFYEEEDDFDESLCPDDQLSQYIPSASESDLDYATAQSSGSSCKFYPTESHLSEAASQHEQQSENLNNNNSVNRPTLHNVISPFAAPFVPYFQKKLNDPNGRYTEEDLRVELEGIVMETFCGWLESIRLTVPDAEIPRTGNDPQHCRHLGYWVKQFERPECEVCHRWMPIFTLMCPGCGIQACVGCKFQYEEE